MILTRTQTAVLNFLIHCRATGQPPPTIRELCSFFGWSSPNAAARHLAALQRKRCIDIEPGKSRAIKIRATLPVMGTIT